MRAAKRMFSVLLTVCMLLSLLPSTVFAASQSASSFTDVQPDDWFYEAVEYVSDNGLMNGTGSNQFSPDMTTTRGMVVTILYTMENSPSVVPATFPDVAPGAYYEKGITWASMHGIMAGYDDGLFRPDQPISREQMVLILYRYAQYKGYNPVASGDLSAYTDASQVSDYAVEAVRWAVGEGLISSVGDHQLNPGGNAVRGQVALILMHLCSDVLDDILTPDPVPPTTDTPSSDDDKDDGGNGSTSPDEPDEPSTPDTPDEPDTPATTGDYSRQEWIKALVECVGLNVNVSNIESSFHDVDNNTYISAVEAALQNGVVDLNDGNFFPELDATVAFASETAVKALGYADDSTSTEECYEIAEAMDLVSEEASSHESLTSAQASSILAGAREIMASTAIDPDAEPIMELPETTVVLDDEIEWSFVSPAMAYSQEGQIIIVEADASSLDLEEGECVLLPETEEYPGGLAQKIVDVTDREGTTVLTTTTPTLDEFIGDEAQLATQGIKQTTKDNFKLADQFAEVTPSAYRASARVRAAQRAVPATVDVEVTEESINVQIELDESDSFFEGTGATINIYYPEVNYNIDLEKVLGVPIGVNDLYFAIDNKVEVEGSLGTEFDEPMELGRFPIPLGAGFSVDIVLFLSLDASGELSLTYTLETTAGIQYTNGRLRSISECTNDLEFKPLDCQVEFGPEVSAMLTLGGVFDLADISAGTGLGAEGSLTMREVPDEFCVDGTCYVFLNISALKNSLIGELLNISAEWSIWDEDNSVFRRNLHFENNESGFNQVSVCTYGQGSIEGSVQDAQTGATITDFELSLTSAEDGTAIDVIKNIVNGRFVVNDIPGGVYTLRINAEGYRPFEREITVLANRTVEVGTLRLVSTTAPDGVASGQVTDALTGNAIEGALVEVYQGSTQGTPVYTATTDSNGMYTVTGVAGNYQIVVSKTGYSEGALDIVLTSPETANQNVTLIPVGGEDVPEGTISDIGDLRIVLTWGEYPSDLDSHLCGPTANGTDRFHIFYSDMSYYDNGELHSFLDHDDVSSYGPETTTVYNIKDNGRYSFYVHDFTNRSSSSSTALGNSQAIVRVYVKEAVEGQYTENGEQLYRAKLIGSFSVPQQEGTVWHVFDYNAATGALTRGGEMSYISSPSDVGIALMQVQERQPLYEDLELIGESLTEKQ